MKLFLSILAFVTLLAGCSQKMYKEIYKKDAKTNFKKYKTFAWLPEKEPADTGTLFALMRNNAVNYFTHCLGQIGYQVDVNEPDLLVELVIKSETKEIVDPLAPKPYSTTSVTTYYNPFLHPINNPFKYNKPFTYKYINVPTGKEAPTYLKNSITLNIIDRTQQKIVWSSTAAADFYDKAYLNSNLHPVVYDMLKKYPVKPYKRHRQKTKD